MTGSWFDWSSGDHLEAEGMHKSHKTSNIYHRKQEKERRKPRVVQVETGNSTLRQVDLIEVEAGASL